MRQANLEDVEWPHARLREADLHGAHLTGSRLPNADLRGANLREAGLGEVDWERADLRAANLRGDFYLVDLREARLDPNQLEHVRRCGAILEEMDQEC